MAQDRAVHIMLGLCTAILVVAALYLARSILAPVAFAIFIIAIVWPLQSVLQSEDAEASRPRHHHSCDRRPWSR